MNRFAIVNAFVKTCVAAVRLVSSCLSQGKYIKDTKAMNKHLTMITSVIKVHRIVAGMAGPGAARVSLLVSGQPVCK